MRVEKWREDAQPGELEDATAAEELPDTDEDGDSTETGSIEDRWARLGVFPAVNGKSPHGHGRNADRTVSLRGGHAAAERNGDRADTDGPPAPRREPADAPPDRTAAPRPPRSGAPLGQERRFRLGDRPAPAPHGADRPAEPRAGRAEPGGPGAVRTERPASDGPRDAGAGTAPRGERPSAPRGDREEAHGPAALREEPSAAPQAGGRTAVPREEAPAGRLAAAPGQDPERTTMLRSPAAATSAWPTAPSARTAVSASVRDPWQEEPAGEPVAVTHDPHEVTVQLDAVQFGADGVLRRATAKPNVGQECADGPVFVDESGRRSRRYRRIGMAVGLACAGYAAVIVATLVSGNSDAPWLPVPGQQQQEQPAGKVETSPQPGETDATPGSGTSLLPGDSPTDSAEDLPEPGASIPAPGTGAGRDASDASADPEPTATGGTRQPGTGTGATPTPEAPVEPATTPPAATPPPADDPAPVTSAPAGDGGAEPATDTVAAPAAQPVAVENAGPEPAPTATSAAAPSPEYVL
ncbi:Translation initiation factor IF-2 OS=Streptomyces pilosus OX=28893 GN=GCM10010280_62350 PE=4 SV=1 [Streptomyces pilosus]